MAQAILGWPIRGKLIDMASWTKNGFSSREFSRFSASNELNISQSFCYDFIHCVAVLYLFLLAHSFI